MAGSGPTSRTRRIAGALKRRLLKFELLDERRVLASIAGQVFHDADLSLRKEDAEVGLQNRVVYLDLNDNETVDRGEPVQLTDAEGRFEFTDLAIGDYVVRLFNGTASQHQTVPFKPELEGTELFVSDPFADGQAALTGLAGDGGLYGYTSAGNKLSELGLEASEVASVELSSTVHGLVSVGDRMVLAWTHQESGGEIIEETPVAVLVDMETTQSSPLALTLPPTTPRISDLAIAENHTGIFVPFFDGDSSVPLYSFQLDTDAEVWTTKQLPLNVASSSQVLANPNGPLVLVAQPTVTGTQVALVSTVTEAVVSSASLEFDGGLEFLAFDDAASLAVAKDATGTIVILDTANNFQTLQTISDWTGQLAFDGHRELLFGVDATTGLLRVFDLVKGEDIASLPLGEEFASTAALALTDGGNRLLIRRPTGVTQVRIDRIDAHRVSITKNPVSSDGETTDILFGMAIDGDNLAPSFDATPAYQMLEDQAIFSPAPGVMLGLENPELDQHIAIQVSQPQFGAAVLNPNGSLIYTPNPNFFGIDTFNITVTDGRDLVKDVPVTISVAPVDDGPQGITVNIDPIPELTTGPAIIGTITVNEVDGDDYVITINDPRFDVDGENVVLVDGGELNFETEPTITITITVSNPDNPEDSEVYTSELTIDDSDDPLTDILPHTAEVAENSAGAEIATLTFVDEDVDQEYVLSVNDSRFEIVGHLLKLVNTVSLDHEIEPTLTLTVTATTLDGAQSLSRDIVVTVTDVSDPITDISLSRNSLPEYASGYRVGAVNVIRQGSSNEYVFGVDDSRFEVVDAQLKLRDGFYVVRSEQAEIQLNITATPVGETSSFSKQFILSVTSNESPWHNYGFPTDVDNDGTTEPLDALIIINALNNGGPFELEEVVPYETGLPKYYDVNGDGFVTPIDALIIINAINRGDTGSAESDDVVTGSGEGEGNAEATSPGLSAPLMSSPLAFPYDDEERD